MSNDEVISVVLSGLSKVRGFLKDLEALEARLQKKKGPLPKSKKKALLKETKQFVEDLSGISNDIKTKFYEEYNKLEEKGLDDKLVSSEELNATHDNEVISENTGESNVSLVNTEENAENLQHTDNEKNCENEDSPEAYNDITIPQMNPSEDQEKSPTDNIDDTETLIENIKTDETSDNDHSHEKDENTDDGSNKKDPPTMIRLVDLSKLLEPKQKKSVKFDSSVIILTSSDEESENVPPKTVKESELKSVLKNSPDKLNLETNGSKKVEISEEKDNDSSEENRSSRKSSRLKSITTRKQEKKEEFKKIFKRSSEKNFEIVTKKSKTKDNHSQKKGSINDKNSASEISDDSDSESKTNMNKKLLSLNMKTNVKVPLPLVECDKLKEVYKKNKDIFSSSRVTRNSKRTRELDGSESDCEKNSKTKKSKIDEDHIKDSLNVDSSKDLIETNDNEDKSEGEDKRTPDKKKSKVKRDTEEAGSKKTRSKSRKTKNKQKPSIDNSKTSSDEEIKTGKNLSDSSSDDDSKENKSKEEKNKDDSDISSIDEEKLSKKKNDENNTDTENQEKQLPNTNDINEKDKSLDEPEKSVEDVLDTSAGNLDSNDEGNTKTKKQDDNNTSNDENNTETKKEDKNKKESKIKKNPRLVFLSDSEEEEKIKKDTSDSSDDEKEEKKKKSKRSKKKVKKVVVSDSDEEADKEKESDANKSDSDKSDSDKSDSEKSDSSSAKNNSESEEKKKPKKSRIKKGKNSSSESEDEVATRKKLRKVLDKNSLSETTKKAEVEERERKARIVEKQKKYNRIFEEKKDAVVEKVVLDYEEETKEPLLSVHKSIVKHLKPHQVSGIQFMYDACFESVERTLKGPGSGCIIAHCMGLGKTLQVVSLAHTLLKNHKKTKVEKVMVVCPINTVLNWKAEFKKWVPSKLSVEVFELATCKKNYERQYIIKEWHEDGGILIIGYNMFRLLSNPQNKKISKKMRECFIQGLVDPGPDLVVCDEGHLLKNEKTNLSIAMNRIKTARRIVLTGTPLQNNLKEYWCMVQFIKPNLLGTYKEYMNRFVNPITNGQYTDSTSHDILLMRKRSHVLHKLLDGVVQRRDYSVLEPYLPPKHEYVLFVQLSEVQVKLYKHYMEHLARKTTDGSNRTSFLFTDYQNLQRICTHPRVLSDRTKEKKEKWTDEEDSEGSLKDFIDDGELESGSTSANSSGSGSENESDASGKKKKSKSKGRVTRALAAQRKENNEESDSEPEVVVEAKKEWWQDFCDGEELDNIRHSNKLTLFFELLRECEEIGDKILVFSQSLYTLNCIEYFLSKVDEHTSNGDSEKIGGYSGTWELGLDYFRLDGSSSCDNRAYWCDTFNSPDNTRARLFLISTRAGGLGINLVAANRVIIFDVSWNPSHDVQSIYRVYRFGQTKPCYVYRFVTYGAMEMKIYERQVTKQAISKRVIDEQQIDRHYNSNDLQELYKCDLDPDNRPIPIVPKDVLLGEMLQKFEKIIYKYHLHQSLLENKQEECLNEEERKAAWEEFENEKVLRKNTTASFYPDPKNVSAQAINMALTNIVRRDNPTWSEMQIKGIIPALVRQLQIQIKESDMSMYHRVVQEIQIINQAKLKESYYQQQMMKYYQQQMMLQQQQQSLIGNLNITPNHLSSFLGVGPNIMNNIPSGPNVMSNLPNFPNGPSTSQVRYPNDSVIELND